MVATAGLELTRMDTNYMKGPRVLGYTFEGVAVRALRPGSPLTGPGRRTRVRPFGAETAPPAPDEPGSLVVALICGFTRWWLSIAAGGHAGFECGQ